MAANICKFHQFGSSCRNLHNLETCTNPMCDKLSCSSRHPKHCKYHNRLDKCLYGASCSYLHVNKVNENNVETLKNDLNNVLALLIEKDKEILELAVKVTKMEGQFEVLSCDNCQSNKTIASIINTYVITTHEASNAPFPISSQHTIPKSLSSSLPSSLPSSLLTSLPTSPLTSFIIILEITNVRR